MPGPATLELLMRYPSRHIETLLQGNSCAGERNLRLYRLFVYHGIEISSDFSGHMCSEDSLLFHVSAFLKHNGFGDLSVESLLRVARVSDSDRKVRKLLLARSALKPMRVFGQMEGKLKQGIIDMLLQERTEAKTQGSNIEKVYRKQLDWLLRNRSVVFNLFIREQFCYKNNKDIRVLSASQRRLLVPEAVVERRPLQVHFAGTPCVAYSPRGRRLGLGDDSSLLLAIYLAERVAFAEKNLEDVCFHENSVTFPAESELHDTLENAGTHKCITLRFSCLEEGWPFCRQRTFTCMYNVKTMIWTGAKCPKQIDKEFNNLFCNRYPVVDGSVFMVSSPADTELEQKEQQEQRRKRNIGCVGDVLSWGQAKRKKMFEEVFEDQLQKSRAVFADINQLPPRHKLSPNINALTRKAQIYSWQDDRLATTYETMLCMGLPGSKSLPPVGDCGLYSPNASVYEEIGCRGRMQMVGNGQHLSSNGAFMLYCFANLMMVSDTVAELQHQLKFNNDMDTDFDDDDSDLGELKFCSDTCTDFGNG